MQSPTSPLRLTFFALATTSVSAFVRLRSPAPFNASNNPHRTTPADTELGSVFKLFDDHEQPLTLCRGYLSLLDTDQGAPTAVWAAGSNQSWSLQGKRDHDAAPVGSCQIGFLNVTTDSHDHNITGGSPFWRALKGYQGDCPAPAPRNGSGLGVQEFNFTVPEDQPLGVTVFAWFWYNTSTHQSNMNCAAVNITSPDTGSGSNQGSPQPDQTSSYAYSLVSTTTSHSSNRTSTTFITLPKTSTILTTTTFTPSSSSVSSQSGVLSPSRPSIARTTVTITVPAAQSIAPESDVPSSLGSEKTEQTSTFQPWGASIGPGAIPMFSTTPARSTGTPLADSMGPESTAPGLPTSATSETSSKATPQRGSIGPGSNTTSSASRWSAATTSTMSPQAESLHPDTTALSSSPYSSTQTTSMFTTPIQSIGPMPDMTSSSVPVSMTTTTTISAQAESLGPASSLTAPPPPTTTETTTTVTPTPTNSFSTENGTLLTSASSPSTNTMSYGEETRTIFSISTLTTTQTIASSPTNSISTTITGLSGLSSLVYSSTPSPSSPYSSFRPSYTDSVATSSSGGTTTIKSTTTITPGASGLPDSMGASASSSRPWISYLTQSAKISFVPGSSAAQIRSSVPPSSPYPQSTSLDRVMYTSTTTTVWRTVTDYSTPSSSSASNSSLPSSSTAVPPLGADRTNNTSHFWTANHCSCACPKGETNIAHCNCFCPLPHGLPSKTNTTAKFQFEQAELKAGGSNDVNRPDDHVAHHPRLNTLKRA